MEENDTGDSTKISTITNTKKRPLDGQQTRGRNIEFMGAIFLMLVYGLINFVSAVQYMYFFGFNGFAQIGISLSIVFGCLLFISAYLGLRSTIWAFLIPIVLSGIDIIVTPVVDGFNNNIPVWDTIMLVAAFLTLYTSFLGLVRIRSLHR